MVAEGGHCELPAARDRIARASACRAGCKSHQSALPRRATSLSPTRMHSLPKEDGDALFPSLLPRAQPSTQTNEPPAAAMPAHGGRGGAPTKIPKMECALRRARPRTRGTMCTHTPWTRTRGSSTDACHKPEPQRTATCSQVPHSASAASRTAVCHGRGGLTRRQHQADAPMRHRDEAAGELSGPGEVVGRDELSLAHSLTHSRHRKPRG